MTGAGDGGIHLELFLQFQRGHRGSAASANLRALTARSASLGTQLTSASGPRDSPPLKPSALLLGSRNRSNKWLLSAKLSQPKRCHDAAAAMALMYSEGVDLEDIVDRVELVICSTAPPMEPASRCSIAWTRCPCPSKT